MTKPVNTLQDTPLQRQLQKALALCTPRYIAGLLEKIEDETVRSSVRYLLTAMQEVNHLIQPKLKQYGLCHLLAGFCRRLNYIAVDTIVLFSDESRVGPVPEPLKGKLYSIVTYLCAHARAMQAMLTFIKLSEKEGQLTLTVLMDIDFIHDIEKPNSILLCIALNEARSLGGRMKADRAGPDRKLFRLRVFFSTES